MSGQGVSWGMAVETVSFSRLIKGEGGQEEECYLRSGCGNLKNTAFKEAEGLDPPCETGKDVF